MRDKYQRLRAHICAGPLLVNREMVAKGMAKELSISDHKEYERILADAQASAQKTFQGRWATTTTGG